MHFNLNEAIFVGKKKRGNSTITFIIILVMFVIFICFIVDAVVIANKEYVVTRTIQFVTRRLSIQGGVSPSMPINFVTSGSNNYLTTDELVDYIEIQMKKAMISPSDWQITVKGRGIISSGDSASYTDNQSIVISSSNRGGRILIDYLDGIDVEMSYKYGWNLFAQATGLGGGVTTHTFKQHSMSEFKYNYDWWEGEHYNNEGFQQFEILETP